ncbi:protein MIGRI [Neisseria wadsworthii]|uniref:protein MIGRI n=1 Tax=Neisseria wadsworthii TaxID=607711 RepID=UPI0012EAD66A|nr:hypothetical protein [Neisseria wadsworthii]QMT35305.1 hypothetical protein H3L96_09680 [Neisseria wadsworthii]
MIGRILRIILLISIAAIIINRLFSRKQKRALNDIVRLAAWMVLIVTALVFLLHLFFGI